MDVKKIVIVGGVAGGASCAARARRNSERAEIVLFERGPFVSFANCGLPYHVGNVIRKEDDLLVASPELFNQRFNIDVRTGSEVTAVDRSRKEVTVRSVATGREYAERYDALVLAPGAFPVRPAIPGVDLPGVFTLRNIPDTRNIREWIQAAPVKRAVVAGAGFIGIEMAENLAHRGIAVTVVEMERHALPSLDPEMSAPLHAALRRNRVELKTGTAVKAIHQAAGGLGVELSDGQDIPADMVLLAVGVKPETALARGCGLEIGVSGGIKVDGFMRTGDPSIYAVGDAVEVTDRITGLPRLLALAGPANRQGRLAADAIFGMNAREPFAGVMGTAVCGAFGISAAQTGQTEKSLAKAAAAGVSIPYDAVFCHPFHHASYYPGAKVMVLKLLFARDGGRILGAQAVGEEGGPRRIDVIASLMAKNGTVYDLEEAELCYAPPYGSAKDAVNVAGMIAANSLRGYAPVAQWRDAKASGALLLDVREPEETARGYAQGAVLTPLHTLRRSFAHLPRDREIWVYCWSGQRSHFATRFLMENGFKARNIMGGWALRGFLTPFFDVP